VAVSIVGTAGATTTSVAIPAHAVGDLIIVSARGTASAPSIPAAAGTVPAWTSLQQGIADSVGLTSAFFVATAATTTTGTWTAAQHICVIVLRSSAGALSTSAARSSVGNAASTSTIVYPALAGITAGSMGVRIGARLTAGAAVGNPPAGWTNRIAQPAATPALALHTLSGLTGNLTADTVSGLSGTTAYRAHTIEVLDSSPGGSTVSGAAALSASGALTSTAIRTRLGASALSALGALSATGTRKRLAATVLGGAGTLSATAVHTVVGEAQLVGGGTLTIPLASRIRIGQAFLSGQGSLSARPISKLSGASASAGAGALSASAVVTPGPVTRTGAAALSGRGSLFVASPTTILANADSLYLGNTPVSVVYVGASEAWRP
jgi:hypothetical protein